MARLKGSKNKDFEGSRADLLSRIATSVLREPTRDWSFRELARVGGVSVPTLRHYFVDQRSALVAILAEYRRRGDPHIKRAASFAPPDLKKSLSEFLTQLQEGWRRGVGSIHALGLVRGIGDDKVGPACVNDLLEPTIQSLEARLALHVEQGLFPKSADLRLAAIELISPLLIALLHQDALFGRQCRPLDLDAFTREHLERFLLAWKT